MAITMPPPRTLLQQKIILYSLTSRKLKAAGKTLPELVCLAAGYVFQLVALAAILFNCVLAMKQ